MKNLTAIFYACCNYIPMTGMLIALAAFIVIPCWATSVSAPPLQSRGSKSKSSATVVKVKLPKRPGVAIPAKTA